MLPKFLVQAGSSYMIAFQISKPHAQSSLILLLLHLYVCVDWMCKLHCQSNLYSPDLPSTTPLPGLCLAFRSVSFIGLSDSYLIRVVYFVIMSRQHKYVSSKPKVHIHFINLFLFLKKSLVHKLSNDFYYYAHAKVITGKDPAWGKLWICFPLLSE